MDVPHVSYPHTDSNDCALILIVISDSRESLYLLKDGFSLFPQKIKKIILHEIRFNPQDEIRLNIRKLKKLEF